jgi:hypothetical protein
MTHRTVFGPPRSFSHRSFSVQSAFIRASLWCHHCHQTLETDMNSSNLKKTITGVGIAVLLASGTAAAHQSDRGHRHADAPVRHHVSHNHHNNRYDWAPRQVFRYLQWEQVKERKLHRKLTRKQHRRHAHGYRSNRATVARQAYKQGYRDARKQSRKVAYKHQRKVHRSGFDLANNDRKRDGRRNDRRRDG